MELKIETKDEPLTLEDLGLRFTAYPMVRRARFEGGPAWLSQTLDAGWRTIRMGTHEIYYDSPSGVSGEFFWLGRRAELKPGKTRLTF